MASMNILASLGLLNLLAKERCTISDIFAKRKKRCRRNAVISILVKIGGPLDLPANVNLDQGLNFKHSVDEGKENPF